VAVRCSVITRDDYGGRMRMPQAVSSAIVPVAPKEVSP
jgi:hypothetical protein